jgi:hypothetical protein
MAAVLRPKARSAGENQPSWGPLTFAGIKGMHFGDLFYAAFGLLIYCVAWPDAALAKDWPALDGTALTSWVAVVLARNLVLEVSFYEFWHQLLFGACDCLAVWMLLFSGVDLQSNPVPIVSHFRHISTISAVHPHALPHFGTLWAHLGNVRSSFAQVCSRTRR